MRFDIESDPRVFGGIIHTVEGQAGVLYNADGPLNEALATPHNISVAIITRNRCTYLKDLIESLELELPPHVPRFVLVNNSTDKTPEMLKTKFPQWQIDQVDSEMLPRPSAGFRWLQKQRPDLVPPDLRDETVNGYGPTESIAWLRNRLLLNCHTRFLISLDDDMLMKPGWLKYFLTFQNRFYSYGVINNFAAFLFDTTVVRKIGWFDERFVRSHGYEDNDYLARMNEAKLRWVLGFNPNHDWRSAEEGNPRGSGTGSDLFIHRYAKSQGGFSASVEEHKIATHGKGYLGNGIWYAAKWRHVSNDTGVLDRPPFKGYFMERLVKGEPDWYPSTSKPNSTAVVPKSAMHGRKTSQNTPVDDIDLFLRPATSTMVDRYLFFSHWCKSKDVLDAGCGHGYGTLLLKALGARSVIGIDMDEKAVRKAGEHYSSAAVRFECADLFQPPDSLFKAFDTIVCIEVFEHISKESIPALIAGLRKMLRPNGTLILTTPRRKTREWDGKGGTHLYEYSPTEFKESVRAQLKESHLKFSGIQEFQIEGSPQWYSMWRNELDDLATVMVAVAEQVPTLAVVNDDPHKGQAVTGTANLTTPRISILLSNRNTLSYLKLALKSCREYMLRPDHEIIVYDDGSTDGSLEWLKENQTRWNFKFLSHPGPDRKGIVYVYDELVSAATEPIVLLAHSDMVFARAADREMLRNFGQGVVGTCTRIEPPLYPEEPFRILKDFGMTPETFREAEFLRFAEQVKDRQKLTEGAFAPILVSKKDYVELGGHDKAFAPQSREDSDLFCRMTKAGLKFVQSWSALCYHFSGRGSRRKDTPTIDSEEWRGTNAKNERNFVRKWGHSVKTTRELKPVVREKRPISLIGLLGNELGSVLPWLAHLEPYFEEVVLVNDSEDGSAQRAREYFIEEARRSPLISSEKLHIVEHRLNGDYAAARNLGQAHARYDWVFHADLDEQITPSILERLQEILADLIRTDQRICGFPRLNVLDGAIVNDIPRDQWTGARLKQFATTQDKRNLSVKNPDTQFRLLSRQSKWENKVHEIPEEIPKARLAGSYTRIRVFSDGWIIHPKSLQRQALQDSKYTALVGKNGPHGTWDPELILED